MKKSAALLVFTLFILVSGTRFLNAQGVAGLDVISMPGFPDLPLDTAYEGQSYTFSVLVANNTNTVIQNSGIEIVLKADSLENVIATATQVSLNPGDSFLVTINGYNFNQGDYAAGNNIVVVWPRIMTPAMGLPTDTFITNVFFVPLNSLSDGHYMDSQSFISVFPNPVSTELNIGYGENITIEYVRIYNAAGQLVYADQFIQNSPLNVSAMRKGVYWLMATDIKGKTAYVRFVVE